MNDVQKEAVVRRRFEIIEDCKTCEYFVIENAKYSVDERCRKTGFYFCAHNEDYFKNWWFNHIWPNCIKNKEEK